MRAHEFLRENNREQEIKNQLLTLLTTLHASQVPSISIKSIQQSLEDAGFFTTNKWISDQVKNIPIVKSSNDDEISLDVETDTSDKDTAVDSEETKDTTTVKKMAKKALKKRKKD